MEIIRETAFGLLEEKGYTGFSVNELAEVSGINISQIYRYFPNGKPDIFLSAGLDLFESGAPKLPELNPEQPERFLISLIKFLIDTHREHRLTLQVMKIVFLSDPDALRRDKERFGSGLSEYKYFENLVEQLGVDAPQMRRKVAQFVFHLVDSVIHRHILEVEVSKTDEELAELLSDLIITHIQSLSS
ncbi:TetR/AcrR family transcriptional regulator [Candidatus Thorarchaeota archaeon]|nr:MAG: TetR/AcrR family transcriptional regulator [Candidatus Thorarchaeota archaeon]